MAKCEDFTLLVVDDEPLIRENIGQFLERAGFHILLAEDGVEAFNLLKKGGIDLVVSDVRMPKGDGIELLRNIQEKLNPRPPLIFVTGFSTLSVEDSLKMGAKAVFPKPLQRKELLVKIREILQIG